MIAPLSLKSFCADGIISEKHSGFKEDFNLDFNEEFVINLMKVLDKEKDEGEKNADFERRLLKELEHLN